MLVGGSEGLREGKAKLLEEAKETSKRRKESKKRSLNVQWLEVPFS